jgi:hypothetical protein
MRSVARNLRWLPVPIIAYLAIALGLPALNGAARNPEFATHAEMVFVVCGILIGIAVAGAVLYEAVIWLGNKRLFRRVGGRP